MNCFSQVSREKKTITLHEKFQELLKQTITLKMADLGRSELHAVLTVFLCDTNFLFGGQLSWNSQVLFK